MQERNAAQPQIEQQPLEPGDASVPATEWVANLRNNLPSIVRPNLDDFEALYADSILDDAGLLPNEALSGASRSLSPPETDASMPNIAASLSLEDFEPSADFQQDAAFLQSIPLEPDAVINDDALMPPPLPETPVCDW